VGGGGTKVRGGHFWRKKAKRGNDKPWEKKHKYRRGETKKSGRVSRWQRGSRQVCGPKGRKSQIVQGRKRSVFAKKTKGGCHKTRANPGKKGEKKKNARGKPPPFRTRSSGHPWGEGELVDLETNEPTKGRGRGEGIDLLKTLGR